MNIHPPRLGALARSRHTSLIAVLGLSTSLLAALPAAAEPDPTPSASTAPAPAADPLASLKAEAKKQNKRIEIESYRTETSTTYANPDGMTLRVELSTEPVRVKKADGKGFTPIDTTLVEADGVIKPKAAKGNLVLSAGRDKTLLKSQAADATAKITTPSVLPEPKLKGNTATYRSAYGKGRDLVVTATRTGFQQQITIAERPTGPVSFRVPVDLPKGMSFAKNAAGRPAIVGEDGKTLTEVRPTLLQDAKAADPGAPLDAGKVGKAAVTLAEDGKTLVFTPDAAFLADPATTYPVTMTAAASDWYEGHTGQRWRVGNPMDTYINDSDLQDSWDNFYDPEIVVGKSYANIPKRWRGYLQFPDIPAEFAGSKVENADLVLWNYQSNDCGAGGGSGITARRITSSWDETTLTWNSQPSVTSVDADTEYGAYSEECNYAWDLIHSLDELVQAWIDGEPNYGIQLTAGNESEVRNWRRYTSEDAGGCMSEPLHACQGQLHPPILTVDFEPAIVRSHAYLIPYYDNPTLAEIKENTYHSDSIPSFPEVSEEEARAVRESSTEYALEDSSVGFNVPDDMTREEWLESFDVMPVEPNPSPTPTPTPQAVGKWAFEEGGGRIASDSSGHGHEAKLNDTAAWIPGKSGSAVSNTPTQVQVVAAREAVRQGKPVEVADQTTATSITYAQPDGKTFTTEITAGPVRTRQGDGWVPIDTTLVEQNGVLKPKAMASDVAVAVTNGGTDAFVSMTAADGQSYTLSWPTALPKPTVSKNAATFTDAAGKGVDLVVTVLPTGFRHDVVLRERPAKPLEIRLGVQTEGLTLSEGKGGRLLLTRGKGKKLVASAPQPVMWDAGVKERLAKGRLPQARHKKITTDVVSKNGRTELVLKPDHAFLSDPATKYPVRVDPTTTLPFNNDVDVNTIFNTAGNPADPTAPIMMVGTETGNVKHRVHLRFDTASLAGTTVTDAKLSLLNMQSSGCGTAVGAGIQARRLTSAWDENNLDWANKPTSTTEDAQINKAGFGESCAGGPAMLEWPVTGIAQDWAAGAVNHGMVLQSPTETNVNNYRMLTSSEDTDFGNPPKLTVTSTGPASVPAVTNLTITPTQSTGGTTVATSLTPQLAATVTDAIGGNLTGEFEIEHDPTATSQGTGQIWTGTSTAAASGGQAAVTVPAGKLADGWKVRWRARAANSAASSTSAWSDWQPTTVDVPNPAVSAFQVTPAQLVDGVTVTTSLTPALHTTVTDPVAQPLRAEFEVEHDPAAPTGQGSGQIWTGAVDNVASGTQASITVADGKLTEGWKVRWRVRAVNPATTVGSPWSDWQSLSVDMPDPVSKPAVGALQVSPSEQVNDTTVTPALTPSLLAQVSDPAGGALRAEVEVEHDPAAPTGQGSGQIWTGAVDNVASGTQASIAVPADTLADGWKVRWRARTVSATAASAWSDWQSFTVSLPKPTATGLTITPSKVVDGATVSTTLTPTLKATVTHPTGQALRAEAELEHDPAVSDGQGSGQIWAGAVDDVASGTQASIAVPEGKLTDGWKVRWRLRVVTGEAASAWSDWQQVTVDVTQPGEEPLAQTAGPVIRTDQSFTAAAWLRWSDRDGDYTVLEQRGTHQAPFRLGNTPDHGLVFTFTSADAANATAEGVLSGVEPPVDEWFHLAGVYDATAKTATLYLNGTLIKTVPISFTVWNADTAMALGSRMKGDLDEVSIYQQALTANEVSASHAAATPSPPISMSTHQETSASPFAELRAAANASAPSAPFPYRRLSHEECQEEIKKRPNRPAALYKNAFNMCWVMRIGEVKDNSDDGDFDDIFMYTAKLTVVMHTYVGVGKKAAGNALPARDAAPGIGSRQMKAWIRVDGWDAVDNDYLDNAITVGLGVSGDCETNYPSGRTATLRQWIGESSSSPKKDFEMTIDSPNVGTGDKTRYCKVKPWVNYRYADLEARHYHLHPGKYPALFRCDTSPVIRAYTGGCIVWHIRPIFVLDENDPLVTKTASHIAQALHDPQSTIPKAGNGVPKNIPGGFQWWAPGCEYGGCLHVTRKSAKVSGTIPNLNRKKAINTCLNFIRNYHDPDSCDEYPFASTLEGASTTQYNFSVAVIEKDDNCLAGSRLGHWYNRVRLLEGDMFWVDTIKKGTYYARSGAPGYVATDPTPEEVFHMDGCTVDG
ncbi:DNRLRE domain-containing protein [Planomonospora sp. ID91781]|uniref:DNRLRE domain-containing protein n=1 Tax=Planomonospora sp. ID91781 TaxID=2738135 RepID=UPI0018C391D4|nr:DNRLRE domain-containing protein [Planomonospora sp. ID91781]MBG0824881.1 DNRLRE domain-containing protein [Planomonospora sp. ID91781]